MTEERGEEAINVEQGKRKIKSQNKLRVEKGPQRLKEIQNAFELQSRKRKLAKDAESIHKDEVKRKKLSREKQKKDTPIKVRDE